MNKYLLSLALAAVGVLVSAGESQAQRWGRDGGWGGRGWGGGGVGISIGTPGYYGGYGYSGWGYPSYGYSNWGYPSYGYSSWGYSPSYSYSSPSYSYSEPYYSTPAYSYSSPSTVTNTTSFYRAPSDDQLPPTMMEKATIEVRLPANAELWLDGQPTTQRGTVRTFESPPLQLGQTFTYEFRARWMEDGQMKENSRQVDAFAGANQKINFGKK